MQHHRPEVKDLTCSSETYRNLIGILCNESTKVIVTFSDYLADCSIQKKHFEVIEHLLEVIDKKMPGNP